MLTQIPQLKRTHLDANVVQTFLTPSEKQQFQQMCKRRGWDMSHALRCLVVLLLRTD